MAELTEETVKKLTKAIEDLTKAIPAPRGAASSGTSSRPGGAFSSLGGSGSVMRDQQNKMRDAENGIKLLAEGSSLLGAAALKASQQLTKNRQIVFFQDLLARSNKLLKDEAFPNIKSMARAMNMLKEGADEFREGLDTADFARFSMAIGGAGDTISKANKKAEELIKEIEAQIDDSGRSTIANIRAGGGSAMAQVAKIQQAGILGIDSDANELPGKVTADLAKITEDLKEALKAQGISAEELTGSGEELIKAFDKLSDETKKVNEVFIATVREHASALAGLTKGVQAARHHLHDFGQKVLQTAATLGSLANIQRQAMGVYSEMMSFNVAQIPDTFMNLQLQSIALGMSFKDTMALYKENARLLSVHGRDSFENVLGGLKKTLNEYGYTFEQGSKMIGPAIENAVLSGVNVRDQNAVSDYMKQTVHNAQLMATVTGRMPEDIIKIQQGILQSEHVFNTMAGMDKERRAAYAKELTQSIDRLVLGGMEYEQAAEVLKIQQQTARAPIREKMEKATMGLQASRMAGLSPQEAYRLFRLEMQTGYADGEKVEMARLQTAREKGWEQRRNEQNFRTGNNALQFQAIMDTLRPKSYGADVAKAGLQAEARKEAGLGMTKEEAERQAAIGRGNEKLAGFGQIVDYVSSFLKNTFIGSIGSVILGFGGIAWTSAKVILAFRKLASSGMLAGAGDLIGAGGPLRGGGTILGKGMRLLKGIGPGAILGIASMLGGDYLEKQGTGGYVASKALGGASWGATAGGAVGALGGLGIGSWLTAPVGAAIGGTLGGLGGAAYGYFTSPGSTTGPGAVNTDTLAAESMKGLSGSTLTVTDKDATMQLQAIAASMNEAVELLRVMVPAGTTTTRRSGFVVPSASEFVTGNG